VAPVSEVKLAGAVSRLSLSVSETYMAQSFSFLFGCPDFKLVGCHDSGHGVNTFTNGFLMDNVLTFGWADEMMC
jgi:hypothetical protein